MGEIADAMLDGTFCETCGEYMGRSIGYPRQCDGCRMAARRARENRPASDDDAMKGEDR